MIDNYCLQGLDHHPFTQRPHTVSEALTKKILGGGGGEAVIEQSVI